MISLENFSNRFLWYRTCLDMIRFIQNLQKGMTPATARSWFQLINFGSAWILTIALSFGIGFLIAHTDFGLPKLNAAITHGLIWAVIYLDLFHNGVWDAVFVYVKEADEICYYNRPVMHLVFNGWEYVIYAG